MATVIKTKKGNKIVLRNPSEKAKRYARQLRKGIVQETGEKLDTFQIGFRVGYLKARSDNAKAYNARKKNKIV